MGLSASQGRMLLLTARKNDLEYRAQQISQRRLILSQELEEIATSYEEKTSNRQMKISLMLSDAGVAQGLTEPSQPGVNLTYATLVSGTAKLSSGVSGIQANDITGNQPYTSSAYYRLVDPDGAIVVSSIDEIPSVFTTDKTTKENVTKDASSELIKTLNDKNKEVTNYLYDSEHGVFAVTYSTTDADGNKINTTEYFKANDGSKYDGEFKNARVKNLDEKNPIYQIEPGQDDYGNKILVVNKTERITSSAFIADPDDPSRKISPELLKGKDGTYELIDEKGTPITDFPKYRVDSSLLTGYTDSAGTVDGPNYLQDCLRNGKYLIQKGDQSVDTNEFRWKSLSWDAATNISDNYFTEDDDTAKAKYDRQQNQIQAQDKKLELELDNIETQRSAVTTEIDSVQKVIDDNVESSFKIFNA